MLLLKWFTNSLSKETAVPKQSLIFEIEVISDESGTEVVTNHTSGPHDFKTPYECAQFIVDRRYDLPSSIEDDHGTTTSDRIVGVQVLADALHPSHVIRGSDASTFDVICKKCGATDEVPGGWGNLAKPCPNPQGQTS